MAEIVGGGNDKMASSAGGQFDFAKMFQAAQAVDSKAVEDEMRTAILNRDRAFRRLKAAKRARFWQVWSRRGAASLGGLVLTGVVHKKLL